MESFKLLVLTVIPPKILYNLTANFSDLLRKQDRQFTRCLNF